MTTKRLQTRPSSVSVRSVVKTTVRLRKVSALIVIIKYVYFLREVDKKDRLVNIYSLARHGMDFFLLGSIRVGTHYMYLRIVSVGWQSVPELVGSGIGKRVAVGTY